MCSTEYAGSKVCTNCGQEKCEETVRNPCVTIGTSIDSADILTTFRPKRTEKQSDPEVVKSVEAKLAQLSSSA